MAKKYNQSVVMSLFLWEILGLLSWLTGQSRSMLLRQYIVEAITSQVPKIRSMATAYGELTGLTLPEVYSLYQQGKDALDQSIDENESTKDNDSDDEIKVLFTD
ncbi:MAG: hypothetical protein F6K63_29790 [Moorea sp. SIO1G6]|uniref:hypothetical protein n=1 Tax=Moorena sp. SIO1G6 TaxID=2607840 RepID=UPI0013C204C5|nr:hypothetical protein [Moorena sp. SIO1G6]NET68362.1 hypothetical protein [Moorena sp. SIO1G6]